MDERPVLTKAISVKDFKEFYWLKQELIDFCRQEGLPGRGSKAQLTNVIKQFLATGKIENSIKEISSKRKSKFDWNKDPLRLETVITSNYKNTQQVRVFFEKEIGPTFKFTVSLMNWIKVNEGKTLADVVREYGIQKRVNKQAKGQKDIAPQFEYNRYLRDFLSDNPGVSRSIGTQLWKIRKSMRGDNVYRRSDLELLN